VLAFSSLEQARLYSTAAPSLPHDIPKGQSKGKANPTRLTKEQKAKVSDILANNSEMIELITGVQLGDSHITIPPESKDARFHFPRSRICVPYLR
jgi:hypothetical protein